MIKHISQGLTSPFAGYRMLRQHRSLWFWALAPALITLMFVMGTLIWAWNHLQWITVKLLELLPFEQTVQFLLETERSGGWWKRAWEGLVSGSTLFLVKVLILGGAAILGYVLAALICGTLWEFLSAGVMKIVRNDGKDVGGPFTLRSVGVAALRELGKGALLFLIPLIIALFSFLPVVGLFFGSILSPLCAAFLFGFALMDYGFSAEELSISDRILLGRKHFFYLTSLGLYVFLPILNVLILPLLIIDASAQHAKAPVSEGVSGNRT